ncbi:MAG: ADP-ribosyltransferase domain-containing protein [Firmicutes bacterium]|nr:ADP-ribosyltransferase domain-containing protein [Bacillota bacterium]
MKTQDISLSIREFFKELPDKLSSQAERLRQGSTKKYVENSLRHTQINKILWAQDININISYTLEDLEKDISTILKINKSMKPSSESMTVYRGTSNRFFPDLESGQETSVALDGLTSTSKDATRSEWFGDSAKFIIYLPAGSMMNKVYKWSTLASEEEVLLPPATYDIKCVTKSEKGALIIELENPIPQDIHELIFKSLENLKKCNSYDSETVKALDNLENNLRLKFRLYKNTSSEMLQEC